MTERYSIYGSELSPYSVKIRSYFRYKKIKHEWIERSLKNQKAFRKLAKIQIIPLVHCPNGEVLQDSTPIILKMEEEFKSKPVVPEEPVLAFLSRLVEEYADEWAVKHMCHYRWHYEENLDSAGKRFAKLFVPKTIQRITFLRNFFLNKATNTFKSRMSKRLWVVGSNDITAPIIENSYKRFLGIMQIHLSNLPFLFGQRPSSADFAIYGQLTQLIGLDPTSRAIAHEESLRTVAWINSMEDLSGINPDKSTWENFESLPASMKSLLKEIGHVYVPALLANSEALKNGDETWETEIDGSTWSQKTFNYQGKCLQWINQEFYALSALDQKRLMDLLEGTGCEKLLMKKK